LSEGGEINAGSNVVVENNEKVIVQAATTLALAHANVVGVALRKKVRAKRVETLLGFLRAQHVILERQRQKANPLNSEPLGQSLDVPSKGRG